MKKPTTQIWDQSEQNIDLIDDIIQLLIEDESVETKADFQQFSNAIYKEHGVAQPIPMIAYIERYREMVSDGRIVPSARVESVLRKRGIRNQSGIAVISLLTKFWGCPGKCIYCPTFEGLPKSYIPKEPAVMRAQLNEFDPVRQIQNRLRGLTITGHCIDKCDVRIIGGTWSVYPVEYQEMFIKSIYDSHTTYRELEPFIEKTSASADKFAEFKIKAGYQMVTSETIEEAKKRNETADQRVVGVQIETRPDWVTVDEIKRLRSYGVTRVEIGYQTTDDTINDLNKRGHGNSESIKATQLLKDAGFKVCCHMMPNLLGSTPDKDVDSMREVFDNPDFRPDEIKIYPMVVTDKSELTEMWKRGEFQAYNDETLIELMVKLYALLPPWVRLNRMYRDIPASEILHGSTIANLRQIVMNRMNDRGIPCLDTCSREIKGGDNDPDEAILVRRDYDASGGKEIFLSYEDPDDMTLFGLVRVRIPSQYFSGEDHFLPVLDNAAIIREIHIFGEQVAIGRTGGKGSTQHRGFGKQLMTEAERIVKEEYADIQKMAVIAGVGVRKYFEMLGYEEVEEYMVKNLKNENT